jgi:hypothetical protein
MTFPGGANMNRKKLFKKCALLSCVIGMAVLIAFAVSIPLRADNGVRAWLSEFYESGVAYWQYPLIGGVNAPQYASGPLPDGWGDQDAIIQADPKFNPDIVPLLVKQLPTTMGGTVQGTMHKHADPELIGWFSTNVNLTPLDPTAPKKDETKLMGTVCVYMGNEMEQHCFEKPTLLYVPPNVPHGVFVYSSMNRPITFFDAFVWNKHKKLAPSIPQPQLANALPDFTQGFPTVAENPPSGPADSDTDPICHSAGGGIYGKYFFTGLNPHSAAWLPASQVRVMPNEIPGVPREKGITFVYNTEGQSDPTKPAAGMHIVHAHLFDEYLMYLSADSNDPHNLGMEYTAYNSNPAAPPSQLMEKMVLTKPFLNVNRRNLDLNCPYVKRNMQRPNGFIIMLIDYDPVLWRDITATHYDGTKQFIPADMLAMSFQYHNEYYTHGLFNQTARGIAPEDLAPGLPANGGPEGDGGFIVYRIEPHSAVSCNHCHGVTVRPLPAH